jgi:hypothetical protein
MPKVKDVEAKLIAEVDRLAQLLGLPLPVTVHWVPSETSLLEGEVKDDRFLVYVEDAAEALTVLRHEVIDYCVCRAITPYQELTNRLIALLNDRAYRANEAIVEALTRLVS